MKKRILIAEDDSSMNFIYRRIFEQLSCVKIVNNADELLKESSFGGNYNLIITDNQMPPGRTGLEVLPELRLARPYTPIILASGDDFLELVAKQYGATAFIGKNKPHFMKNLIFLIKI